MTPISLSEYFNIQPEELNEKGVFDRILGVDSKLFVDPYLFENCGIPEFVNAREKLKTHYSKIIKLLKYNNLTAYHEARRLLQFKETKGIGIGYGKDTDFGNSIGRELSKELVKVAKDIIDMGIEDPEIFEIVGLFQPNFGADRLSDMTISILRDEFFAYTERVTKELGVKDVATFHNKNRSKSIVLPYIKESNTYTLFVPHMILRDLPIAHDWDGVEYISAFNGSLRKKYNKIVADSWNTSRKKIINKFVHTCPKESLESIIKTYKSCDPLQYDFRKDKAGEIVWYENGKRIVEKNPVNIKLSDSTDINDVLEVVERIIDAVKNDVEYKGANIFFFNDSNKPRHERYSQKLFHTIASEYCKANNLDISPETNSGRGPVDFKVSRGQKKVAVEVKLTSNKKLFSGFTTQLPIYQKSENAQVSIYLVFQVNNTMNQYNQILELKEKAGKEGTYFPRVILIDARLKPSASKAKTV